MKNLAILALVAYAGLAGASNGTSNAPTYRAPDVGPAAKCVEGQVQMIIDRDQRGHDVHNLYVCRHGKYVRQF